MPSPLFQKYMDESAGDMRAFRDVVLGMLRQAHPDRDLMADLAEEGGIVWQESRLGLHNLLSAFNLSDRTEETLSGMLKAHFETLLSGQLLENLGRLSWGEAKPLLRAQLMPRRFTQAAKPLLWRPFYNQVCVGVVVDEPKGYRYLMADEAVEWQVAEDDLYQVALANLAEQCRNTQIRGTEGDDRMLLIASGEGYAAAHILIEPFRAMAEKHLGSPFCFGIPNRDFLICWNASGSRDFHAAIAGQLARDFEAQPYALCPNALLMDAEGRVTAAKDGKC